MRKAFTLVELLVVVAIIALLISVLLPSLSTARKLARTTVCMNNQRQIGLGFLCYANDWNDCLPGGTWDFIGPGTSYNNSTPLCWLGSLNSGGDREHMPFCGTIFNLVGSNEKAYKCPDDAMDKRAYSSNQSREKPHYSYTAPALLTGAPLALLVRTRWGDKFTSWNWYTDWYRTTENSLPWMVVEEDEVESLAFVMDSAWSNVDILTNRHRQRATVTHTDGSVSTRAYQRAPAKLDAWKVYYELSDGRIVSAGNWGSNVRFGYIRNAPRLNPP